MFLKSAHVQHFKSLDDIRVDFSHPITVIVGRNAAGKTNLVDALCFASETVQEIGSRKVKSIIKRGGIERIRQKGLSSSENHPIKIQLEFSADAEKSLATTATIEVNVAPAGTGISKIEVTSSEDDDGSQERWVAGWRHANIYPNTLRQLSSPHLPEDRFLLLEDGSNWASVVQDMRTTDTGRAAMEDIIETMRLAVPGFLDIQVEPVNNYLVPHFIFETSGEEVKFDPQQLSDGTLRLFALLLSIHQQWAPDWQTDGQLQAPELILIDEPENTIYPGAMGILVDAIREASETTQFIITTHSPDFVRHFKPEEIRIATSVAGRTQFARINRQQTESIKEHLLTIDEFMRAEGLQPELTNTP